MGQARTDSLERRGLGIRWGIVLILLLGSSCGHSDAEVPLLSLSRDQTGSKLLRPNAQASACRTALFWESPAARPVDVALQELHDSDPEANALLNVRLRTSILSLGVAQRECATVTADVVRTVPVLYVPSRGGGHKGHQQ